MTEDEHQQTDLFGGALPAGARASGQRGPVAEEHWARWLADPAVQRRYRGAVYAEGPGDAWWLGAISSTGHGKFRVGAGTERRVVSAHVYGYQLAHGRITDPGDVVVAHACDEPSCQRPEHLRLASRADNIAEYAARRWRGPLVDVRGAAGRAVAIRDAILRTRRAGGAADEVAAAVATAQAAGMPPQGDALF